MAKADSKVQNRFAFSFRSYRRHTHVHAPVIPMATTSAVACTPLLSTSRVLRHSRRGVCAKSQRTRVVAPRATASSDETESSGKTTPDTTIVVFGANGKTGRRCVEQGALAGANVVACTRAGDFNTNGLGLDSDAVNMIEPRKGDVSKLSSDELSEIVTGATSVIFAASASPNGGTPEEVDKNGLIAVATACIQKKVPRLVIVSSGSVSKPLSPVYIFLNFFGGVMRSKIEGEDAIRRMYVEREFSDYVIVRPGGLTEDPGRGASAMELNQGDLKSGRVSREDVAGVCVALAMNVENKLASNATFECYWSDTANDLSDVGVSNMLGAFNADDKGTSKSTGKEQRGETWEELLQGVEADKPGEAQQGWGPSL